MIERRNKKDLGAAVLLPERQPHSRLKEWLGRFHGVTPRIWTTDWIGDVANFSNNEK